MLFKNTPFQISLNNSNNEKINMFLIMGLGGYDPSQQLLLQLQYKTSIKNTYLSILIVEHCEK